MHGGSAILQGAATKTTTPGFGLPPSRFLPRRYKPRNVGSWSGHLAFASDLIAAIQPSLIVELGTHWGESYFTFCQTVEERGLSSMCYAVDHWQGDQHAGQYGEEVFAEVSQYNDRNYKQFSYLLRRSFDDALSQFADDSIDLLHIDGLHTYEAVRHDFNSWLPKVKAGGIILLHDICPRHHDFGVWRLWDEIKAEFPDTFDFHHSWGLGVAGKQRVARRSTLIELLFDGSWPVREDVRRHYVIYASHLEKVFGPDANRELPPWRDVVAQVPAPEAVAPSRCSITPHPAGEISEATIEEDYARWVAEFDTLGDTGRDRLRQQCLQLKRKPLISIIVPPDKSPWDLGLLCDSLTSVCSQAYGDWELCLPVTAELASRIPGSPLEHLWSDSRIRKIEAPAGLDSIEASNTALATASGDFVGFLFPGDRLGEDALFQIATGIVSDAGTDIFFTDEDSIDSSGRRQQPRFKPGWDRDLLLASSYVGQFTVFRRLLLGQIGRLRRETEDCAYWDLLLRAAVVIAEDRIRHLPWVCYHRRRADKNQERTATHLVGGSQASIDAIKTRILSEHLQSCEGLQATFAAVDSDYVRVVRPLPHPAPLVSIIIPTRDRLDLLQPCVEGLLERTNYQRLELLIVDNGSQEDATLEFLRSIVEKDDRARVLRYRGPFNYSAMNNRAAGEAHGDVLLLLNNDIEVVSPDWLEEMISHVIRPEVGAVGAKLLYPDGRLQHGGVVFAPNETGWPVVHLERLAARGEAGYLGQLRVARSLSAVTGACLAIRRDVYQEVGGLDEDHMAITFSDIDLCLRLGDLGYKIIWTPFAELVHHESASRKTRDQCGPEELAREERERQYFCRTWGRLARTDDPFHNPNLRFGWNEVCIPVFPPRARTNGLVRTWTLD